VDTFSRRAFLYQMVGLATLGVAGCSPLIDHTTQPDLPQRLLLQGNGQRSSAALLLNRAAFGPRPGQVEQVEQLGRTQWIEQQLDYESIPDEALDLRLRRYDTLNLSSVDMHSFGWDKYYIAGELGAMTLIRAIYSERQLYERMVGFWSDHFNIYAFKDEVIFLKTVDDREVIRRHALGKFGDLLRASAHSPAMLRYLDNTLNEKGHPNENYAREIMELHTLGVHGGYTEQHVKEVARCLTGWTVNERENFLFCSEWHDTDAKTVLGATVPPDGGQEDGEGVLNRLIDHPSTRQYVCTKLVRHFVADDPATTIVNDCVQTWEATEGDIRAVMRTLLNHPDFDKAPPKFKRPFDLVVSALRATNGHYDGDPRLMEALARLGQRPFAWARPDGYPDTAAQWQGNLLGRWNFCVDVLHGNLPGANINVWDIAKRGNAGQAPLTMLRFFGRLLLSRNLETTEEATLWKFATADTGQEPDLNTEDGRHRMLDTLTLLIAGPAFQLR
jgi:uncharacterized protein (DUF1800 family)